jgi:hypothetical protein
MGSRHAMDLFTSVCASALMLLAACDGAGSRDSDAGATFDAGPCQSARPGIHVTFNGPLNYGVGPELSVTVGSASEGFSLRFLVLTANDAGLPSVALPYPQGSISGPARIDFYAVGPGLFDTVGHEDFEADINACVDVQMDIVQQMIGSDAGVGDAAQ